MTGPARAGLFIYAKDLDGLAAFYESLLGMTRLHASAELVILQSPDMQLVLHQVPAAIASTITIASPPRPREESALKFFFTLASIADARAVATSLGGQVLDTLYRGRGFVACNVVDPEGNLFHVREPAD